MTFKDLPHDWAERRVDDPAITADVLDLVVRDADRLAGAVAVLVCNPAGRLVQPVVVGLPPEGAGPGEHRRLFDLVCRGMTPGRLVSEREDGATGGILVVVARDRGTAVTGEDRRWHDDARASAARHGIQFLGAWVVTRSALARIDDDPAEARLA